MPDTEFERRFLSGLELYGDNFGPSEIASWYEHEKTGYYTLATERHGIAGNDAYAYEYDDLNCFHAFGWLRKRNYGVCVALGCARGDDVAKLAPNVSRFVAIEPAQQWWSNTIGGKPATFMAPEVSGDIPLSSRSADLAVSLGVLHHIPNVSHVVEELARILKPGGFFVLREPITSMGDWRIPRVGLTRNERGLPLAWLDSCLAKSGFSVRRKRLCMINVVAKISKAVGIKRPYNHRLVCAADWLASQALAWNLRYYRKSPLQKLAASSVFYIVERA
jgi:SAM-dependent methyltransferase